MKRRAYVQFNGYHEGATQLLTRLERRTIKYRVRPATADAIHRALRLGPRALVGNIALQLVRDLRRAK